MKLIHVHGGMTAVYIIIGEIEKDFGLYSGLQIRVGAKMNNFSCGKAEHEIYFVEESDGRKRCLFPVVCRAYGLSYDGEQSILAYAQGNLSEYHLHKFYDGTLFKEYQ